MHDVIMFQSISFIPQFKYKSEYRQPVKMEPVYNRKLVNMRVI